MGTCVSPCLGAARGEPPEVELRWGAAAVAVAAAGGSALHDERGLAQVHLLGNICEELIGREAIHAHARGRRPDSSCPDSSCPVESARRNQDHRSGVSAEFLRRERVHGHEGDRHRSVQTSRGGALRRRRAVCLRIKVEASKIFQRRERFNLFKP